ncbi:MAG: ribonuclease III, partial [Clostridia bacterium]|nr:ribonuclease III [Clostridia bacterium]
IGYRFQNEAILRRALTHSSYANEEFARNEKVTLLSNERLEFLGDSVLSMVTTEYLYTTIDDKPEGELTKIRAQVVCESALYQIARAIGLGRYLYLGRGEEHSGGRERPSILADATEALIAALYLDGGIEAAKKFILTYLPPMVETAKKGVLFKDYKTTLQEIVQKSREETISYAQDGEEGPDHAKRFHVTLFINSNPFAEGVGKSKKEAEQNAARSALILMGVEKEERHAGEEEPV